MILNENKGKLIVGAGLVVVAVFLFFQLFYAYHLFFLEQIQLFNCTKGYWLTFFQKPAWLSSFVGEYLTQFFYLRYGGPIVLAFILGAEWLLTSVLVNRFTKASIGYFLSLLLVASDWALHLSIQCTLAPSIGILFLLSISLLITSLKHHRTKVALHLIISIMGYWLIGSLIFIYPFIALISLEGSLRFRIGFTFLLSIIIASTPVILRDHYLLTWEEAYIYPITNTLQLILILLALLLLAAITYFYISNERLQKKWVMFISLTISGIILSSGIYWIANFELEKTLSLDSETYFGNTNKVLENAQKYQQKTTQATYFTNLALAEKGILPDYLLSYYQPASKGLFLPVHSESSLLSILFSNEVFYRLGDMNMAQHSAMLGMIFLPSKRSSRLMKRLAEINMVIGQNEVAKKYLNILKNTTFHRQWAEKQLASIEKSPSIKPNWVLEREKLLPQYDTIRTSDNYKASLELLLKSNPNNTMALDYLLCYHLLNKDVPSFTEAFKKYYPIGSRDLPQLYAEGLIIQMIREKASESQLQEFGISPSIIKSFAEYTDIYAQNNGKSAPLEQKFRHSYWFYYHFAQMNSK